jgi:hypothetical protein
MQRFSQILERMRFRSREHFPIETVKNALSDPLLPKIGEKYKHYNGTTYQITFITWDEKSQSPYISYTNVSNNDLGFFSGGKFFDEWLQNTDSGKQRFVKVEE